MTKKINYKMIKVDPRIVALINNGVEARHRSMFVVIGDKSCYRVKEMHYLLGKAMVKSRPSVLWCNKNNLSNKKKRRKQVKSMLQNGLLDQDTADSFTLFLDTTGITYCLYRESERVLGNTFDMCVLQDFEALTPNLLARTIETVVGGGVIMILLRTLSSLTSFYTMVMDVQKRYRTESHNLASGRFNERFMLSLASCKACIVMDDEVHILPISSHMKTITPFSTSRDAKGLSEAERELKDLKEQDHDDFLVGPLIRKCCTMDQARGLLAFLDAILEKSLGSTIALLASRGRGKSATLGLAIAGAVAAGYSNIFVTAPGPENLKTLFEFVCVGLNLLNYKKSLDYDVVESNNPKFKKATVVQIIMKKQHRQTIQYIQPHEHQKLSQVELLVIDEAATIPLPTVKSLLGPYLVFLSSTVNGYEGTGRSLSLKLLKQLEDQNHTSSTSTEIGWHFKKVTLSESVRYASGDPVESWLNSLLCLDVSDTVPIIGKLPPPSECELYYVNRDTLFSYHKDSELFLKRMMGLYVASHYKNSPNDLQLIADAPAHHLFVLLGPVDESSNILPDILCVIQICFEGQISRESVLKRLGGGEVPNGDQLPWKFCEQFRDTSFPSLSGARIVRIATHPSAMRLGYGSAAVELLARYFEGQLTVASELDSVKEPEEAPLNIVESAEKASLQEQTIKPRNDLPPLLVPLHERQPEKLHYLGVSFGLTLDLFRLWRRHKFAPFYIGRVPNSVTGEYTCMVLRALNNADIETDRSDQFGFFSVFYKAFKKNFLKYLNRSFRQMEYKLAMSILDPKISFPEVYPSSSSPGLSLASVSEMLSTTTERLKLEDYTNDHVQHHAIEGFIDELVCAYFWEKIPVTLSYLQASVLLCFGLQAKEISKIQEEMGLKEHRIKRFLKDAMIKFKNYFESKESHRPNNKVMEPHPISVDEDLNDGSKQVQEKDYTDMQASIMDEPENSFPGVSSKVVPGMLVSIKSDRSVLQRHEKKQSTTKSKRVIPHKSNSSKKRKSG